MIRKAFVMQVNPDAHEEYQRRHNPIWPELEAVLKDHGAHHYAIYLDKERHLLFATVEIESGSPLGSGRQHGSMPALVEIHARGDAQQPGQQPAERGAQRSVLSGVKITGLPPDGRPVV